MHSSLQETSKVTGTQSCERLEGDERSHPTPDDGRCSAGSSWEGMGSRCLSGDAGTFCVYLETGSKKECTDILTPLYQLKFTTMRIYPVRGNQPLCYVCKDCESTYNVDLYKSNVSMSLHKSDVKQCVWIIRPLYQLEDSRVRVQRSSAYGNWVVHQMDLSRAGLGVPGARALGDILYHITQLQTLDLDNNNIGDSGSSYLASALKMCTSLQVLDLQYNALTDGCVQDITELIMSLKSLTLLWLQRNRLTEHGKRSLEEAKEKRSRLANYSKLDLWL